MDLISTLSVASTLLPLATQVGQATLSTTGSYLVSYMKPGEATVSTPALSALDADLIVEELDVAAALQTAQALIACVAAWKGEEQVADEEWEDVEPRPRAPASDDVVCVCVRNLRAATRLLRSDLAALDAARTAHLQKWFASWRASSVAPHVHALGRHKRLFDARLKILLDVVAAFRLSEKKSAGVAEQQQHGD
jgi:hypothetical protein